MNVAKTIPLSKGKVALVDDEDFEMLSQYNWHVVKPNPKFDIWYAQTNLWDRGTKTQRKVYMHRLITNAKPHQKIDHHNGNSLDNQRANLRHCTQAQNIANMKKKAGSSQYKGVYWDKRNGKWMARITLNYKGIFLGRFVDECAAAKAYNVAAQRHFGAFARLNSV